MWRPGRRKLVWLLPAFVLTQTLFFYLHGQKGRPQQNEYGSGRQLQSDVVECIPASIQDFPEDFFTQEERITGGVIIHILIATYLFATLAIVCDDYFVPSLEVISESLKVPTDVAGATFMAIGTSSPELFSSVIGSFITEGDIGIGTIVGSAVFNILGVTSLAGLAVWGKNVPVDWYPITRDSSWYTMTVVALILVIYDNIVYWWEALILVILFALYILVMYFNKNIEAFCLKKAENFKIRRGYATSPVDGPTEKTPLLWSSSQQEFQQQSDEFRPREQNTFEQKYRGGTPVLTGEDPSDEMEGAQETEPKRRHEIAIDKLDKLDKGEDEVDNPENSIWSMPVSSSISQIWWVLTWPSAFLLHFTVPDCRKKNFKGWFPITFTMSVLWIAGLSYLCVWMVTVIAYTLYIPDTVAGITLLAIGTSVPEVISSVIVVRNGLGNMAICNLLGSNIFDILFCLGAPWLIKAAMSEGGILIINSSALTYTTATLLTTVVMLYVTFYFSKWNLNRNVGFTCMVLYVAFLVLACMYELNVFGDINPPACPRTN